MLLDGNDLESIPTDFGKLSNLTYLNLSKFWGEIFDIVRFPRDSVCHATCFGFIEFLSLLL